MIRWLLAQGAGRLRPEQGSPRLTIVRHHRVYADRERPLYRLGVSESVLDAQVRTCVRAGLSPVTVREGLAWLAGARRGHRIAFTFDDGYADNLDRAIPILQRHGARASFYLTVGLMQARQAPWWDELAHVLSSARQRSATVAWPDEPVELVVAHEEGRQRALRQLLPLLRVPPEEQRSRLDDLRERLDCHEDTPCALAPWEDAPRFAEGGMEAGAHTMGHPFLSLLSEERQAREIRDSVRAVRDATGAEVAGLAYPNGDHDDRTVAAAQAAGLRYAVTTRTGDVRSGDSPFRLLRRGLSDGAVLGPGGGFSAAMAAAELSGRFDGLRRGREAASS